MLKITTVNQIEKMLNIKNILVSKWKILETGHEICLFPVKFHLNWTQKLSKITMMIVIEKMLNIKNILVPKWTFLETDVMKFAYSQSNFL